MTTNEVAELLGLTPRRVQQGAATLGVRKYGRDYYFTKGDVEKLRGRIGMQGQYDRTKKKAGK